MKRLSRNILQKNKLKKVSNNKINSEVTDGVMSKNLRKGWNDVFRKANSLQIDSMIDGDGNSLSSWDEVEWKW